jgi:hypothetical protein
MFLNLLPKPKVPQLSVCSKSKEGNQTLYRKVSGDDGAVICVKNNGQYIWKFLDGKIAVFFKENTKFIVLRLDILFLCVTGNNSSKTNTMPSTIHCMKYVFRTIDIPYNKLQYDIAA